MGESSGLRCVARRCVLPPSEWSPGHDRLDQGTDDAWLRRSTCPRKLTGSCVGLGSCWVRAARPPGLADVSRSAGRPRPSPGRAPLPVAQGIWRPEDGSGSADEGFGGSEYPAAARLPIEGEQCRMAQAPLGSFSRKSVAAPYRGGGGSGPSMRAYRATRHTRSTSSP